MVKTVMGEVCEKRGLGRTDPAVTMSCVYSKDLVRTECAKGVLIYQFECSVLPVVRVVARVKPDPHLFKAGNVNNIIYNTGLDAQFLALLDVDMMPLPHFLDRTLPLFFQPAPRSAAIKGRGVWQQNKRIAFVQAPQSFRDDGGYEDAVGGRNSVFFQAIQAGRDGVGLSAFSGTNVVFYLKALKSIKGLLYSSITGAVLEY